MSDATTSDLTIRLSPQILERHPQALVGAFRATELEELSLDRPAFTASAQDLEKQGVHKQNLVEHPNIQGWRQAIGQCGLKPSSFKSSPEQLARRLLKGQEISTPLPLVNAYCAVSVRHLAPMGAYDLARLPAAEIELRLVSPRTDRFAPLGGRTEDMPMEEDVASYACGDEVICWAYNHRDSRRTCLQPDTRQSVFIAEAVTTVQQDAVYSALQEMASELEAAGAKVGELRFADGSQPQAILAPLD